MVGTPKVVSRSYAKILEGFEWEHEVRNSLVVKEPIGVVAMITPWNFPLYLNLAKIHLASGSRAMAFQTLARGLRIAPDHEGLSAARAALGLRQRPWLRFLPRSHILNRSLGAVRARLARTSPDSV